MPGTLGDRVFVLDQFLNVPVCKSRAQHVLGVEVLDCRRPAGAVFQLFGCVAQQQDVAAGAGQLFHHLKLAVAPLRPDELDEDTDHPVKSALQVGGRKAGCEHIGLDEFHLRLARGSEVARFFNGNSGNFNSRHFQPKPGQPHRIPPFAVRNGDRAAAVL